MQTFGLTLEGELQAIGRKAKNQKQAEAQIKTKLNKWLSSGIDKKQAGSGFRDPAKAFG